MSVNQCARSDDIIGIYISIFFNMTVYYVFSLESHHRGDSNEYTQYKIFNIKNKITLNYHESAKMDFFQGTQERA